MKATIKANGCLVISAESEFEAYALKKWNEGSEEGRGSTFWFTLPLYSNTEEPVSSGTLRKTL